jgi:hypothetical protein
MPRSKAQLSRETLRQMNVYAPDEEPSAEDAAAVEGKYDTKLREWRDDGLVYWLNGTNRNTEEIPDQVFGILCDLMENEVRNQFKGDNPPVQRLAQETVLLSRLRRHLSKRPSGESTTFSSY